MLTSWLSTWWRKERRRSVSPRRTARLPYRTRLQVESLEDRCLMSNAYLVTNLVSDQPGVAKIQDTNLVNSWGLDAAPGGPWWVADNGTGVSTLYDGNTGQPIPLVVNIPLADGSPSAPTGLVFNGTGQFAVSEDGRSGSAFFIFATEDGTISGWNPFVDLTHAVLAVDNSASGAVYKGLALGNNASGNFLYATNFHAGSIDVFDSSFHAVSLSGSFTDPNLPSGYAPFGIRNINGNLYVTYALQDADKHDDVAGPAHGFVDIFDTNGNLERRLITHGHLDSPWGLAVAPADFGDFSNALLIGNFGNGRINAYDPNTGAFLGVLSTRPGRPIVIDGLWALSFGNGSLGGPTNALFFTSGPDDESHGLFGDVTVNPAGFGGGAPHGSSRTAAQLNALANAASTFSFNVGQPPSITSGNGSTPGADHGASQNQTGVALLSLGEVGAAQMPGGTFHPPGTNGDQGTVLDGGLTKNPFGSGQ